MSSILKAISSIMADVGSVQKAGTNEFHRYKYTTAADILHKLQPLMAREGLVVFQTEQSREMMMDGSVLAVTYAFSLAHKDGEVWPSPVIRTGMSGAKNSKGGFDDKALNKCHTSAHKYFHLTLFEIPTGDYDDADADEDKPTGNGAGVKPKRTMKEISENKARKENDYESVLAEISEINTAAELEHFQFQRLTPEFMAGMGQYQFLVQEHLERRRQEIFGEPGLVSAPSNEPQTKAEYIQSCHEQIDNAPDEPRLLAWWKSEVHARKRYRLSVEEVNALSARCDERFAPAARDLTFAG